MWQSIAKAVLHAAVHSAVRNRQNAPGAGGPPPPRPPERPRPRISIAAVLLGILGSCCLASGLLSALGSLVLLTGARPTPPGQDPVEGLVGSACLCFLPSALFLGFAFFAGVRAARLRKLVALAEAASRPLALADVAAALRVDLARARSLVDHAVREGFVDPGRFDLATPPPPGVRGASIARDPVRDASIARDPARDESVVPRPATDAPTAYLEGTCPFCRTPYRVADVPGGKPRCPSCRVPITRERHS